MKKIIITSLVAVASMALYAAPAASTTAATTTTSAAVAAASNGTSTEAGSMMMVSNGVSGASQVNMTVVNNPGQAPKVVIDLAAPAMLSIYDQNGNLAFSQQLQPGQTTVDTANFPLGNDQLVVTSSQPGVKFTMTQNVTVNAPQSAPANAASTAAPAAPQAAPAPKLVPAKPAPATIAAPRTVAQANS